MQAQRRLQKFFERERTKNLMRDSLVGALERAKNFAFSQANCDNARNCVGI